jgi:hypothetical protein
MEGSQFQTYDIETSQLDDILSQQYEALKSRIEQSKTTGLELIGQSIYPLIETGKKLYSGIQTIADQANTAYENLKPLVETPLQSFKSAVEIPEIPQEIEMTTFLEPQLTRLPSTFNEILGQPSTFKYTEPQIMDVQDHILSLDDLGDAFKLTNQPTAINAQQLIMESDPEQLYGETAARISSTAQEFLTSTLNDPLTSIANEAVEQYANMAQTASDTFASALAASNTAEASDVVSGAIGETAAAVGETAAAVGEGVSAALATGEVLAGLADPILGVSLAIFGLYEGIKSIFDSSGPAAPVLAQQVPSLDIGF